MKSIKYYLPCVILLFAFTILNAQIIHIPDDEPTIQMGIEAAAGNGDTVLVAHGTYYENLDFLGKEITVASHYILDQDFSHIVLTKIDGSQPTNSYENSLVYFRSGEDTTSVLCGFTLTNGSGTEIYWGDRGGGAIYCYNSSAKVIHNRIVDNHAYEYEECAIGGAIFAEDTTGQHMIVIKNNIINNNIAMATNMFAVGGALFISMPGIINHNDVCNNLADGIGWNWGGGINLTGQFYGELCYNKVKNNTLRDHNTMGAGVIVGGHPDTVKVMHNTVNENFSEGSNSIGGGFYISAMDEEHIIIIESNIIKNNVAFYGAGMRVGGPVFTPIVNNLFDGNEAYAGGGGLYITYGSEDWDFPYVNGHRSDPVYNTEVKLDIIFQLINNTFVNNTAWLAGGGGFGCNIESSDLIAFNNIIYGNSDPITTGYSIANVYIFNNNVDTNGITGLWSGKDNYYADPDFIDDSCHISNSSCCVNSGVPYIELGLMTIEAPAIDIDGNVRPDDISNEFDVGADENDNVGVGTSQYPGLRTVYDMIKVFPNPCKDIINISFLEDFSQDVGINIYTFGGGLVKTFFISKTKLESGAISLDVSDVTPGLYIVNIENNNVRQNEKVLINP